MGWFYASVIVFLTLTSLPPPDVDLPQADKIWHVIAYFFLMFWFMQLYESRKHRWIHLGVFLVMGAGLEVLQDLGGVRHAEWLDMVANSMGVGLGYLAGKKFMLPLA